jgi:hypothetical protein
VEAAVERRLVQVMFTVPKEKLRVVNATPGEGDGMSISDAGGVLGQQEEEMGVVAGEKGVEDMEMEKDGKGKDVIR